VCVEGGGDCVCVCVCVCPYRCVGGGGVSDYPCS